MANSLIKVVFSCDLNPFFTHGRKFFKPLIHFSFPSYHNDTKSNRLSADVSSLCSFIELIHAPLEICFCVDYLRLPHASDIFFACLGQLCVKLREPRLVARLETLFTILGELHIIRPVGFLCALP